MTAAGTPVRVAEQRTLLDERDTFLASVAVRSYLTEMRGDCRSARRKGRHDIAERVASEYVEYLDLYELLGGDVEAVPAIDTAPHHHTPASGARS